MPMKLNRKNKNGSWTLTGEYTTYRKEGGQLSPEAYNQILKELK